MSASARNRTGTVSSGRSSARGRSNEMQDFTNMSQPNIVRYFEPCAATASMFLYAQGCSVVCCHHDTLTIERRFSRHSDEVRLLAVDTQSEVGAGRLVVSYDAGQTAIVWDLMTGDEVARFASYEHLTTAAWMRNGNVAFGNTQGNIILFEPTTSEHISSRTIDQIAVTSLAPAADCRTFAIGYQNGSLLVATLQPRFTILHNLGTSRAPSPIVTLNWHASSSRQKSDMLAAQTHDGDLRVWSVSKSYSSDDPAKVVRILKRTDNYQIGANWMGWSKNGRIIQFTDSETLSWDVRTKHVTWDSIPTLEHVRGLAVYGPGASLFTLGANNTVQQFDLNTPSIMVANVQHPANLLPPSPPVSIEEQQSQKTATTIVTDSDTASGTIEMGISESDEDHMSPFDRIVGRKDGSSTATKTALDPYVDDSASAASSRSGHSMGLSEVSKGSGSRTPNVYPASAVSRGTENTWISVGSTLTSAAPYQERPHYQDRDAYSMSGTSMLSGTSMSSYRSRRSRPSRLRNEVVPSPVDNKVTDLFKYTRSRLSDIPYKHPAMADDTRLTNDDLRRQMLSTIFGWNKEIEDLIREEISRHQSGSPARILLLRWLGDLDADVMAASSASMTSSDWMLLALSGIGGDATQHKLGRAYVQRLLEHGDVNAAVTILIGMGDINDAIEIYVSHKKYMEALILTCLFLPAVWERQSAIIKKWGEWAVMHGQQQLAVRCFACTGAESDEPWTSPSAAQVTFQSINQSVNQGIPEILSPPLSPPGISRGPQRSIAKTSALKLITSFGEQGGKSKFFSQTDGGQTPIAAGPTPIADSAVSPGGYDVTTAFIRPSNRSQFNTPSSARSGASGFSRKRLPSIGEIPGDLSRDHLREMAGEASPRRNMHSRMTSSEQDNLAAGMSLQRAATASPMMMRDQYKMVTTRSRDPPPPSPDARMIIKMEGSLHQRNGSRDRKPKGLHLTLDALNKPMMNEITSPEQSVSSSTRFHWPSRRRGPGSVASSVTSQSTTGRSYRSNTTGGRQDYIHSLETAQRIQQRKQRSRHGSREGRRDGSSGRDREHSRSRKTTKSREASAERGRASSRTWQKPKRSPTSPIPMSPEDLINLSTPKLLPEIVDPATVKKANKPASRASSRGSQIRRTSPEGRHRPPALDLRGRSQDRSGSHMRSPSSPLPLSANLVHYQGSEDEEDFARAVIAQENFRNRHNRSTSQTGSRKALSPELTKTFPQRDRSESRRRRPVESSEQPRELPMMQPKSRAASKEHAGDLKAMKDERQRKKEEAARELEERRKSLAQRPSAPPIPHPSHIRVGIEPPAEIDDLPPRSHTADLPHGHRSMYARSSNVHIGLPATPKAMRLIIESDKDQAQNIPVPPIPATFAQRHSPVTSPQQSPEKEKSADLLTLLPQTTYQPPVRGMIPRSMSAPPIDLVSPTGTGPRGPSLARGSSVRRGNPGEVRTMNEPIHSRRASREERDNIPPPPPPPMLKELQHLAMPPPPPPAPLPYAPHNNNGGLGSGMIEIVMDDDEPAPAAAPMDTTVPVLPAPAPPAGKGHSRGRSFTDRENSLAGRLSKATDRFRSGSRTRKDTGAYDYAPYESVPMPSNYGRDGMRSPPVPATVQNQHTLPTGLNASDMI
ncbi:WD g-beta repeat protein [Colletotrichum plurivorum]|uniref:WD g-beta repeat protein n=1 Tax=Colletotrichum plurivorum TaxID=2175906 RepID=A0A8H6NCW3_9PEZI|nr:WD g-beta repeat protein [Colletotrichum plurivorum]